MRFDSIQPGCLAEAAANGAAPCFSKKINTRLAPPRRLSQFFLNHILTFLFVVYFLYKISFRDDVGRAAADSFRLQVRKERTPGECVLAAALLFFSLPAVAVTVSSLPSLIEY